MRALERLPDGTGGTISPWNATGWYNAGAGFTGGPNFGYGTTFCFDPALDADLYFGAATTYGAALNQTWAWNATGWHQLSPARSPPALGGGAMAWDASDQEVILFGGTLDNYHPLNATWAFANGTWTNVTRGTAPPGEWYLTMFSDAAAGSVITFGGFRADQTSGGGLSNATWEFLHGRWSALTEADVPPAREEAAASWDSASNEGVMFGGLGLAAPEGGVVLGDTWSFVNGTWKPLTVTGAPAARSNAVMGDFAPLSGVVLFGGNTAWPSANFKNDTWVFNGTHWQQVSFLPAPPLPFAFPMGFATAPDGSSQVLLEPASSSANTPAAVTWEFSTLQPKITVAPSAPEGSGPVTLSAAAIGATYPERFDWTLSDGTVANGTLITHRFAAPGTYSVTVLDTDTKGRVAEGSRTVSVYPSLSLQSAMSPPVGNAPLTVSYSAALSGGQPPYGYAWRGPGLTNTNASAGTLQITQPGNYAYVLYAEDAGNYSLVRSYNITVVAPKASTPLSAWAVASATTGIAPFSVDLAAGGIGGSSPYTFAWVLGNGATAVGPSVVGVYANPGTYTAQVQIADAKGSTAVASVPITVLPMFSVALRDLNPNPTAAVGFNATPQDGSPPFTYYWNWGDGSGSTGTWANHTFARPGDYLVRVTAVDGAGATATAETNVSVPVGSVGAGASPPPSNLPPTTLIVLTVAAIGGLLGFAGVVVARYRRAERAPPPRRRPPSASAPPPAPPRRGFERPW